MSRPRELQLPGPEKQKKSVRLQQGKRTRDMGTKAISKSWFDVDRNGLAKLLGDKSMAFVVFELLQNAWDTNAKRAEVHLEKIPGTPKVRITVIDDDPDGFSRLTDAWTICAESEKKVDPTLRGRFNMGEKFVLAVCYSAVISTTTGTVTFDSDGRHVSKKKRETGSSFVGIVRMNQEQFDQVCEEVATLIPPDGCVTYFNGTLLERQKPLASFEVQLPTVKADEDGVLKSTKRITRVDVFEPEEGIEPMIYELGIPVVGLDSKWHIDVQQKVPLNMNRDNVTPSYLLKLQVAVANHLHNMLSDEDVKEPWVAQAVASPDIEEEAFKDLQVKKFGDNAVVYDPSDREANFLAVAEGRPLIHGGSLSAGAGANNRRFGVHRPAGQVTPSPKPFSEGGEDLKMFDEADWTEDMKAVAAYVKRIGEAVLDHPLEVEIARDQGWPFAACYRKGRIILNYSRLGKSWFASETYRLPDGTSIIKASRSVNSLLVHEFAHHYASSHLSKEFYDACCSVGARFTALALEKPELFRINQ